MYELVKKIINKSLEEKIDIGVAYDKLRTDDKETDYKPAYEFLRKEYTALTALNNNGKDAEIKVICDMAEKGNNEGVNNYIKALKDEGVI